MAPQLSLGSRSLPRSALCDRAFLTASAAMMGIAAFCVSPFHSGLVVEVVAGFPGVVAGLTGVELETFVSLPVTRGVRH